PRRASRDASCGGNAENLEGGDRSGERVSGHRSDEQSMGALGVMNRSLAVSIAVGAIALSSCARIAERAFAQPTIAVRSVKLKSIGLTGGSIEVALAIANPNPYPLPVQHAVYSFALRDSTEVGRGESAAAFTLPAHDSTVVDLPIDVSWQGLRAA